ncbi:ABC transporter ATP-binding protein [Rhizobium sp. FKY42]|uniref:ABC transporter ATP-binding protein n=1 Tax=Rhizobium sp. FKY42 TaxID=2562310 RepID=UPI0010C020DB|nr:ABC transporter ATP-binding protein [Rhizobium sp. FKY42]
MKLVLKPIRFILTEYLSESKLSIALLLVAILIGSALSVLVPYHFSRQLDQLSAGVAATHWLSAFWIYAMLLGISVAFQRGTQYLAVIQAERLGFLASRSFFDRLITKRPSFFVDHNPAEIQSAQSQGTQAITVLVQVVFIAFLPGATSFGLTIGMLGAVIDLEIVLVVLAYGTIFLTLIVVSNRLSRRYMEAAIDAGQANARYVGNAISMIEPLRQAGSARWMKDRFADSAVSVFQNWQAYAVRRIGFAGLVGISITLQFGFTFFLLLPRYHAGTLSIGDIVLFNTLLLQLNVPFELIGQSIDETLRAIVKMGPLARIWSEPEEEELGDGEALVLRRGAVEFRDVSYRYPNGRGTADISFKAERGRITFITGETGSGKSTLFKLLLKAVEPDRGAICIDGVNLGGIPRAAWFATTGIVPQEILLLNDSLKTNITLGRPVDETRLKEAARKAAILNRIEEMPEGFETTVGERGLKLSGGERQRIAIARALYSAPSLLLLDEASSALDDATEAEIMDQLRLIGRDMTIIAITHRLSSIQPGDQVIELQSADISQMVTRENLPIS